MRRQELQAPRSAMEREEWEFEPAEPGTEPMPEVEVGDWGLPERKAGVAAGTGADCRMVAAGVVQRRELREAQVPVPVRQGNEAGRVFARALAGRRPPQRDCVTMEGKI